MFKDFSVDALGIALLTWILHIKGMAVNRKARYIWHRNIAYLKGYHVEDFAFSETNAASFRFLEDFFIIVGVLLVEKHCTFSEENCNWMKHASLRTGDTSLLHLILHFRTGMRYHLNVLLNIMDTCFPSREGSISLFKTPCIF